MNEKKIACLDGQDIYYDSSTKFYIQVGKGKKGAYKNRYAITGDLVKAGYYYNCIPVENGYKKRLVMNRRTLVRSIG